jgi:hypothetical protein
MKWTLTLLVVTVALSACVSAPQRQMTAPVAKSPAWFQCETAFECVVVYDSFCQMVPVNQRFAIRYQDWSLAEVERIGERSVCPDPGRIGDTATCYEGQCVSRLNLDRVRILRGGGSSAEPPPAPAPPVAE